MDFLQLVFQIVVAVITFGLIIFIHELGHFLVAKSVGITVHEFALGMGPKLWSMKRGETTYALRLVPIGGFVPVSYTHLDVYKRQVHIPALFDPAA